MRVSKDEYELPEAVAESAQELATMLNVTRGSIETAVSHYKAGRTKWSRYRKIEISEGDQHDAVY